MTNPAWTLAHDGVERRPAAVSPAATAALFAAVDTDADDPAVRRRAGATYATRNLLWDRAGFADRLTEIGLDSLAADLLGAAAVPIQALFFDKTPASNWKVTAHQDVVMPFAAQVPEPGFERWTTKAGVPHAAPPDRVLAGLVALRLHLDDCPASNGALAVIPGSHRGGRLDDDALAALDLDAFHPCEARAGDVIAMRPLLVHRSSPATAPTRRRVVHVVYATEQPGEHARWRAAS